MKQNEKKAVLRDNARKSMDVARELPWNNTSPDDLGPAIMRYCYYHEPYFRKWAETWFVIMQYVFGQHNFRWSARQGYAVDSDILTRRTQNNGVRSYTNIARIAVESLASGFYANNPNWDVDLVSDSATFGRKQKRIIQRLLDGTFEQILASKDIAAASFIFSMFGQVAFESLFDQMAGRVLQIPNYQMGQRNESVSTDIQSQILPGQKVMVPTPRLDANARPYMSTSYEQQRNQDGSAQYLTINSGNVRMNVLTPFEYFRQVGSIGMHKTKYVQIYRLMDYDEFLDMYSMVGGRTKNFGAILPITENNDVYQFAMKFYNRLRYVTPPSANEYGSRWGLNYVTGISKKVMVIEHYDEPHLEKWPTGRRVIVANGQCTHVTRPDYNTNKIDGWHPLSEAQWINSYPSSIASGPLQDLVQQNKEINAMNTFIAMAMRRSLGGQYLVKTGSGIDPNRLTGEPGLVHEVTDPNGIRILHDELAIPPVVGQIISMRTEAAYQQSAALEFQRGVGQEGSSGVQTKLFEEKEEKRLAPARRSFREALAGAGEKLVWALHKNVIKLDDATMGYMLSNAAGDFTPSDVVSFLSTPLNIGLKVKIDAQSMTYRSPAQKKADMAQLMATNPMVQQLFSTDKKMFDSLMKLYGFDDLRQSNYPQYDRAEKENETFIDMIHFGPDNKGISYPRVLYEDDDAIHLMQHAEFIVRYWDLVKNNKWFLLEYYTHMETHRLQQAEKQMMLMPGAALLGAQVENVSTQQPMPNLQQVGMDANMRQIQQQMMMSGGGNVRNMQQQLQAQMQNGRSLQQVTSKQQRAGNGPGDSQLQQNRTETTDQIRVRER